MHQKFKTNMNRYTYGALTSSRFHNNAPLTTTK
jgi:hypothetical protein